MKLLRLVEVRVLLKRFLIRNKNTQIYQEDWVYPLVLYV